LIRSGQKLITKGTLVMDAKYQNNGDEILHAYTIQKALPDEMGDK